MPTRISRRITAREVARRAGVSQSTVSLVRCRIPRARVAAETRAHVLRAANRVSTVGDDSLAAGTMAAEQLLRMGHRTVAFIWPRSGARSAPTRQTLPVKLLLRGTTERPA